jgi:hypothetical protein
MKTNNPSLRFTALLISLALMLALAACSLQGSPTSTPATHPPTSEPTTMVIPTSVPTEAVAPMEPAADPITVDVGGVAQSYTAEVVPAASASEDNPLRTTMPEYTLLTLHGYPVTSSITPQIYLFPVQGLSANQAAGKVLQDLQAFLQRQEAPQTLPFPYLPLTREVQMMLTQLQNLNFQNGNGVRYVTEYANGIVPINNDELLYTYQGLTDDGRFYVAVVAPINLSGLPANATDVSGLPADFLDNYMSYKIQTVDMLDHQPAGAFTPDLSKLDALVQSIVIK